ncbi:MAG: solute carrier family 23 protein [Rhodospirillales bacterium]
MSISLKPDELPPLSPAVGWRLFVPKLYTTLRQGYSVVDLRQDLIAGLTVAIVALPLAMALAIASGATPDKGLITAVVAGFIISALGGSRFQIGGPTGAFVVVVFDVIQKHGYDGLIVATLMAGIVLTIAGFARLGTWIKYIPTPVVTGFTAGIAVIIFSSQVKDFFGLTMAQVPAEFLAKWQAFWAARDSVTPASIGVALGSLAIIVLLRKFAPKFPGFLIAIVLASLVVAFFGLPIDTIGTRFGGIASSLPAPHLPVVVWARLPDLLPSAFTIAFLAGVESLLSAVVADGMTGRRHRSNCELVAQGIANIASALFGGMPATGAIARTATNIRSGARSPIAGMAHALFVLLFMLLFAPLANYIPLASLAAVLTIVAWNMSEIHRWPRLLRGPWGDRLVLLITFGLTVMVDLTVAIEVGVVLAAILFMHRMAQVATISTGEALFEADRDDLTSPARGGYTQRDALPTGVEVFKLRGPLFFGAVDRLNDLLDRIAGTQKVFILRMREVSMIDATGATKLRDFVEQCSRRGIKVVVSGLQPQARAVLAPMKTLDGVHEVGNYAEAIELARRLAQ